MAMADPTHRTAGSSGAGADELSAQLDALRNDVVKLGETLKDLATRQVGEAVGGVQDAAAGQLEDLEAAIKRNPTQATLIAAGVGFALGLLLSR